MQNAQYRNLTLALLLIVLGIGLLVQQLGIWDIPWSRLWVYWPLIIVFIGLEILLRRVPMGGVIFIVLALATLALVFLALPDTSPTQAGLDTSTVDYPLNGLESATIQFQMDVGRLEIRSLDNTEQLYRAELHHRPDRSELIVQNEVTNNQAEVSLRLRSERFRADFLGDTDQIELALTPNLPLALVIDGGVGQSLIDLSGLEITDLDLNVGVGAVNVTLPDGNYEATLNGGVGALTVELPQETSARIVVDRGLSAVQIPGRFERSGDTYITRGATPDEIDVTLYISSGVGAIRVH